MPIIHKGRDGLHRVTIAPAEAQRVLGASYELCDMPLKPIHYVIASNMVLDWQGWGHYNGHEVWELGDYAVQTLVDNSQVSHLT